MITSAYSPHLGHHVKLRAGLLLKIADDAE
jgi:hypothetical protein